MSVVAQTARQARLDRVHSDEREQRWPGALSFFALTFAWSWSFFAVAILLGGEWPEPQALLPWAIGALGPAVAAFLLVRRAAGKDGARTLLRATIAFRRIGLRWWAAMLALAAVRNAAAIALQTGVGVSCRRA